MSTDDDPCNCSQVCPHGDRCLGGHANYPDNHWYVCDTCTPKRTVTFAQALAEHEQRRVGLRQRTEEAQ